VRISRQDFGQQSGAQKLLIGLEDEAGNPAALRSLARGYCWLAELAEGSVKSVAEIARREGLTDRYVSRLIDHSLDYNAL
jgi:hypothetical protein